MAAIARRPAGFAVPLAAFAEIWQRFPRANES
jgi:hypothetical protein